MTWQSYFTPQEETKSLVMNRFSDDELGQAYAAYQVPEKVRPEVRHVSEGNPYMVRLASEVISESGRVVGIQDLILKEFYIKRVLRGTLSEQRQKHRFLSEFADIIEKFRQDGQDIWGVLADNPICSGPAYKLLELDGIISQEKIRDPFPQIVITLNPPQLAESIKKWHKRAKQVKR
jgi:hypothetical protein